MKTPPRSHPSILQWKNVCAARPKVWERANAFWQLCQAREMAAGCPCCCWAPPPCSRILKSVHKCVHSHKHTSANTNKMSKSNNLWKISYSALWNVPRLSFLELDYTGKPDVEKVKGKMRRLLRKLRLRAVASLFFPTEYFSRWSIHQCKNMPDGLTLRSSLHAWPFTFPLLVSFGPCKNSNWKCKIDGRNEFSLTDSDQSV